MVKIPFLNRCHICGAKEGLVRCMVCGKQACLLHIAGGKCHSCLEAETLAGQPMTRSVKVGKEAEPANKTLDALMTRVKIRADPTAVLADLYLLLGGRPGSRRSTTLMGSLHLDQRNQMLMFDRQVARRINAASFVRLRAPGLGEVETRPYRGSPTTRLAHDHMVRMLDLVSRARSAAGVEVIGGNPLMDVVELNREMPCPHCGSWLEVCQCPNKVQGSISGREYFRAAVENRLRQWRIGLRMHENPKNEELLLRIARWSDALVDYL